jgi:protein-arginine kinase activator protein McsA
MTPYCQHCGATNVHLHISSRNIINGKKRVYHRCNKCETERMRAYYKTKKGKAIIKKQVTEYERKNPKKKIAWNIARIIPLQPCCVCGSKKSQRHHPDYSNPLVVVFLCAAHHKELHRKYDNSK